MEKTYKILRFYEDDRNARVMYTGLTLEEAQKECSDPETSSTTAKKGQGGVGCRWFHGYTEEI